jgi:DNA-binding CsgD family transcriptional regulator
LECSERGSKYLLLSRSQSVPNLKSEAVQRIALQIDDPDLLGLISTMLASELDRIALDQREPDVVVADHLPVCEGVPIIVLEDSADPLEILKAGARGVLPRSSTLSDLLLAIDAVARGFAILPRDVQWPDSTRDLISNKPSPPQRDPMLTARELEVLRLMAEGASNKLIARRLGISFHTAKFHVASIAAKLYATGRTDAVAQAVRLGFILL